MTGGSPRREAEVDRGAIEDFLELVKVDGNLFEIRALGSSKAVWSGLFDDRVAAAREVFEMWGKNKPCGVYYTLNPLRSELCAAVRRNKVRSAASSRCATDKDVQERQLLLIDCDPVRPRGVSATADEHAAAIEKALTIREVLVERGIGESIVVDSGNGAQLLVPVLLAAKDRRLVQGVLRSLAGEFDDERVKIDQSVHNPSRIARLPGTLNCKGKNEPDRPHRMAAVLKTPTQLVPAEEGAIRGLVTKVKRARPVGKSESPKCNDIKGRLPYRLAEGALAFMSEHAQEAADDRETWLWVGMALRDAFGPVGRELWDEWSRSSSKFEEEDQHRTWRSFARHYDGPKATLRSIFRRATEAGWGRSDARPPREIPVDAFPAAVRERAEEVVATTGAPIEFALMSGLSLTSLCCGARWRTPLTHDVEGNSRLFVVLVGPSATRKTSAMTAMSRSLELVENEIDAHNNARRIHFEHSRRRLQGSRGGKRATQTRDWGAEHRKHMASLAAVDKDVDWRARIKEINLEDDEAVGGLVRSGRTLAIRRHVAGAAESLRREADQTGSGSSAASDGGQSAELLEWVQSYLELFPHWKKDAERYKSEAELPRATLRLSDASVEALLRANSHNPLGVGLVQNELRVWIDSLYERSQYGWRANATEARWCGLYDGGREAVERITRDGFCVERSFICVLGGLTQRKLNQVAQAEACATGLFGRLTLVLQRSPVREVGPPAHGKKIVTQATPAQERLSGTLRRIWLEEGDREQDTETEIEHFEPRVLPLSKEAHNRYWEYSPQAEATIREFLEAGREDEAAIWGRHRAKLVGIAMLFALLDGYDVGVEKFAPTEVPLDCLENAIRVQEVLTDSSLYVLRQAGLTGDRSDTSDTLHREFARLKRLYERVSEDAGATGDAKWVRVRDWQRYRRHDSAAGAERQLEDLVVVGYAVRREIPGWRAGSGARHEYSPREVEKDDADPPEPLSPEGGV